MRELCLRLALFALVSSNQDEYLFAFEYVLYFSGAKHHGNEEQNQVLDRIIFFLLGPTLHVNHAKIRKNCPVS